MWNAQVGWRVAASHKRKMMRLLGASLGPLVAMFDQHLGNETGSAQRVADVVVKLARHDDPPAHLLPGSDAVHYASMAEAARAEADSLWREVSLSTDLSRSDPIPPFPQT